MSESARDSGSSAGTDTGAPERRCRAILSGTYRILEHLGSGGMGDVYEVEHLRLGRRFAAKFLRADLSRDLAAVERFQREGQAMALLRSNYVASIVDAGTDADGTPFLVMERLYGSDLRGLLVRYGSLAVPRAVGLVIDAALGLRAVHAAGLVHGDVKPANLFVSTDDNGADVCRVLDFGLARSSALRKVRKGMEAGTVRYMAPEQLSDGGIVDHRTDIHALGTVLYECLAGRPPHVEERIERVVYDIMHETPSSLLSLGVTVPRELDRVVLRALSRDPAKRFGSADAFIDALSTFEARRTPAGGASARIRASDATEESRTSPRLPRRVLSRRSPLGFGLIGALLGAGAVAVTISFSRSDVSEPRERSLGTPGAPRAPLAEARSTPPLGTVTPLPRLASTAPASSASVATPATNRVVQPAKSQRRAAEKTPGRSAEPLSIGQLDFKNPYTGAVP
jgi:serine/threonine-protein kinase